MQRNLEIYMHDHLAGAQFATSLLSDMAAQDFDVDLATFASTLLREIEEDKKIVEEILSRLNATPSALKEASAWIVQKLGRVKLQIGSDPFSIFEACEVLSIGIQGKVALWNALATVASEQESLRSLDFPALAERALEQYQRVERRRIAYVSSLLADEAKETL